MELYFIPFQNKWIIYRPLRRLAFLGNAGMVRYIKSHTKYEQREINPDIEAFLNNLQFWELDPPLPKPWRPNQPHLPTMAVLLMTSACNLRCTYCYARGGEENHLWMSFPLVKAVIEQAYENACQKKQNFFSLAFHGGGEPTLNWDVLTSAVEYARSKNLKCFISMSTNGMWDEAKRDFILKHFTELSISFDGIPEVQNAQRPKPDGSGSFDTVIETIHTLDKAHFRYGIRVTVTPLTFHYLPQSIAFLCKETKCSIIQVEPCYTTSRGEYQDPSYKQAQAFIRAFLDAFEIADHYGRILFYSGARPGIIAEAFCRAPEDALIVTPEGDVVTCFETHDRRHPLISRFVIGRATPEKVEIHLQRLQAFAELQIERQLRCRNCFCYWHCRGDCTSRCFATSRPKRRRCFVNREITRELLAWHIAKGNGIWKG